MANNIVCWFEIYTDDIDRAKRFYSSVLGCTFQEMNGMGESMKMACFSSPDSNDVSGALVQMDGMRSVKNDHISTIVYFPCEDCSIEESQVLRAGGTVVTPKMSLGEHGFCSICTDTEGNTFGLHSMR